MSIAIDQAEPIYLDVQNLRMEAGWYEVAKGLNRIFLGYLFLVLGMGIIGGLVGFAVAHMVAKPNDKGAMLGFEVTCMVAIGAVILLTGYCYGKIVLGHWNCLKHAPERYGAKWMIFACITCVVMGPALNVSCSVGGVQKQAEFRRGPKGFKMPQFDQTTRYMQMASSAIALTSFLLFMGFLRAVALCFSDQARATHVTIYIVYFGLLWIGTYFLLFTKPGLLLQPPILVALGMGWVVSFFWHMVLIFLVRATINHRLELVKSPLEA